MLSFGKKKSVVGIDVGNKSTKIVSLIFSGTGRPLLEKCQFVPVGLKDETFTSDIKSVLRELKIGHALVVSAMDDPSMKIRKVELPQMPEPDLIEAIRWNLRDIVEGNIDDFFISYSKISESNEGDSVKLQLMAYAVNRNAVANYQATLQSLGVEAFFIEPAAVTLASTLERCHGNDEKYISGINLGYNQSLFYVVGKGVFVFSRPLLGIGMALYESEPDAFNQKLAIEVQKSIDTFKVNFQMEDIIELYLSGGGALIEGLREYLQTNLGLKTEILNPFVSLEVAQLTEDVKPPLFAQAVGLAYVQI